ncbi:MAG: hypothetical protein R3C03_17700 [Pirellulaceae bacterium]
MVVNSRPVDVLDSSGRFFALVQIEPGSNRLVFEAIDEYGQKANTVLELFGESTTPAVDFSQFLDITGSFSGVYGRTRLTKATVRCLLIWRLE